MTIDISAITEQAISRLGSAHRHEAWAVCTQVWGRWWVMAEPVWNRHPHAGERVHEALAGLDSLDFDDDGSAACQYAIDPAADLLAALTNDAVSPDVSRTIQTYLEGEFNVAANALSDRAGHPVSHADALWLVETTGEWQRAVGFVNGLIC